MNPTFNGLVSLYAAIFLLAGNGYFAKEISINTFDVTAYRSLVAVLILFLFMKIKQQRIGLASPAHYSLSIALGILLGVHWVTFFYSMRISTVALGMTVLYTYPIITVFLERLFFNKPVRLYDLLIAVVMLFGIWLMASPDSGHGNNVEGVLVGLFSAFCFACRNVTQQRYLRDYPPYQTIFYQVLVIGLLFVPFTETGLVTLLNESSDDGVKLLLLGIAFTALPHSLLANSLRSISAKSVALIGCMQPVIGTAIAFYLINETPTAQVMLGASIVLLGAIFETVKPNRVSETVKQI